MWRTCLGSVLAWVTQVVCFARKACQCCRRGSYASVCSMGRMSGVFAWVPWYHYYCYHSSSSSSSSYYYYHYYYYNYYWNTIQKKNVECFLLKQRWKKVPNRFEQWFKRRTWLEEQVLIYTIWTGSARILNITEFFEIYTKVGQYSSICVTLWICLNMCEPLQP